jgi:hypothetical protein
LCRRLVACGEYHDAGLCDVGARRLDHARHESVELIGAIRSDRAGRAPRIVDDHRAGSGCPPEHVGELRVARRDKSVPHLEIDERRVVGEAMHAGAALRRRDKARDVRAVPVIVARRAGTVVDIVVTGSDIDGDRVAGRALLRIDSRIGHGNLHPDARPGCRIGRIAYVPAVVSVVVQPVGLDCLQALLREVLGSLEVCGAGVDQRARRRAACFFGGTARFAAAPSASTASERGRGSDTRRDQRGRRDARPERREGLDFALVRRFAGCRLSDDPCRKRAGHRKRQRRNDLSAHAPSMTFCGRRVCAKAPANHLAMEGPAPLISRDRPVALLAKVRAA